MRTKHLLTAMALPLVFAACTQDEVLSENNFAQDAQRQVVEGAVMNFSDLESRMAYTAEGYTWETGDKFGACLMDVFSEGINNGNAYHPLTTFNDRFTLIDYRHTNYPFTRNEDGNWYSEAVMAEGNYFYYFPYVDGEDMKEANGRRSTMKLAIPTDQVLAKGAKAMSVLNNQVFVGYRAVKAADKSSNVTPDIEPLLGTVGFKIYSSVAGGITIRKIALVQEGGFPSYYEVLPAKAQFNKNGYYGMNATNKRKEILKIAVREETYSADKISLTFEEGKYLAEDQAMTAYMMLPEMSEISEPFLYIYTDKGLVTVDLAVTHEANAPQNASNIGALEKVEYGTVQTIQISFTDEAVNPLNTMNITSTDELDDLVKWNKDVKSPITLNAYLMPNSNVELTKEAAEILEGNDWLKLSLINEAQTPVTLTIAEDAPAYAWDQVDYITTGINVVNKANLKLTSDISKNNIATNLWRNEGTMALAATITSRIVNNGEISIVAQKNNYATTVSSIINHGTVTSDYAKATIAQLYNWGKLIVNKSLTVLSLNNQFEDNDYATYYCGNIENNSILTIVEGENNGKIVNNGELVAKNEFENTALNIDHISGYPYTVEVVSIIENYGSINNVLNSGEIVVKTQSASVLSNAASTGVIDNTVQSDKVRKNEGERIKVVLDSKKASEIATIVAATNASILELSGTVTVDPAEDETMVRVISNAKVNALDVTANNLKVVGPGKLFFGCKGSGTASFTVNVNKTVELSNSAIVEIGGKLTVDGKLVIANNCEFICGDKEINDKTGKLEDFGPLTEK